MQRKFIQGYMGKITAVTMKEMRGQNTFTFHLSFLIVEFLSGLYCVWDMRHSGHYNHSWCIQNLTELLFEPVQHRSLCIRNSLQFEHIKFSQKQTFIQGFRSKCYIKKVPPWSSCCGSEVTNPTSINEDVCSIPGVTQWVKDPALLSLRYRPAAAAPIWPLAWNFHVPQKQP